MLTNDVDAVLRKTAQTLIKESECRPDGRIPAATIETIVYSDLLKVRRPTDGWQTTVRRFPRGFLATYTSTIASLRFQVPVTTDRSAGWFSVATSLPKANHGTVSVNERTKNIYYKEYFTLMVEGDSVETTMEMILRFLELLPELLLRLTVIGEQNADRMVVKVPDGIPGLVAIHDSLVIHYQNPALRDSIRDAVYETYRTRGIVLEREFRGTSGFDFRDVETSETASHSELIARIVAAHLSRADLRGKNTEELAAWLRQSVATLNEGNPPSIARTLEKHAIPLR